MSARGSLSGHVSPYGSAAWYDPTASACSRVDVAPTDPPSPPRASAMCCASSCTRAVCDAASGGGGASVRMRSATRQNQGLSNHFHVPYEAVISSSRDHVLGKPWSRTSFAGSQLKMPLFGLVIFVSTANPFDVACSSTKQSPPALGPLPGLNGACRPPPSQFVTPFAWSRTHWRVTCEPQAFTLCAHSNHDEVALTPSSFGFAPLTYLFRLSMYSFVAGCCAAVSNGLMYAVTYTWPWSSAVPASEINDGSYTFGCRIEYFGTYPSTCIALYAGAT